MSTKLPSSTFGSQIGNNIKFEGYMTLSNTCLVIHKQHIILFVTYIFLVNQKFEVYGEMKSSNINNIRYYEKNNFEVKIIKHFIVSGVIIDQLQRIFSYLIDRYYQ